MRTVSGLAILLGGLAVAASARPAEAFARLGCFQAPTMHRTAGALISTLASNLSLHLPAETRACNFYARGLLYHLQNDTAHAIADYTSAIAWMHSYADAYAARGDAYEDSGQHALAIADYAQANAFASDSAEELVERCWIRALRGHPLPRALDDCTQALRQQPDDFNALASRALVYLRLASYAAAIADCDEALKQKPGNATALFVRALAKQRSGDAAGADADLAAAKSASSRVADTFALYGVKP